MHCHKDARAPKGRPARERASDLEYLLHTFDRSWVHGCGRCVCVLCACTFFGFVAAMNVGGREYIYICVCMCLCVSVCLCECVSDYREVVACWLLPSDGELARLNRTCLLVHIDFFGG
jgi:hypothetical protein